MMNLNQRLSHRDRERFTQAALQAAQAGGRVLNRFFNGGAPNVRQFKGRNDLVTTADLESCRVIKRCLKRSFPDHSFLFEEQEFSEANDPDFLWIVDPLDGTTFHNRGLPFYGLIIALQRRQDIVLGMSYSPYNGNLFTSAKGHGSLQFNHRFRIARQLKVSATRNLDEAIIGYSYGKSEQHAKETAAILSRLFPVCRSITALGGDDIGYVAAGCCDAFIDNSSTPWDFAAFKLMIEEAAGQVTDLEGKPWSTRSRSILLTNGRLHTSILKCIRPD